MQSICTVGAKNEARVETIGARNHRKATYTRRKELKIAKNSRIKNPNTKKAQYLITEEVMSKKDICYDMT